MTARRTPHPVAAPTQAQNKDFAGSTECLTWAPSTLDLLPALACDPITSHRAAVRPDKQTSKTSHLSLH